jgi:hypothetical protein
MAAPLSLRIFRSPKSPRVFGLLWKIKEGGAQDCAALFLWESFPVKLDILLPCFNNFFFFSYFFSIELTMLKRLSL